MDLAYLLDYGGVFEPLRDREFFGRLDVYPERQTIFWPKVPRTREGERAISGDSGRAHPKAEEAPCVQADIAPETLYARARRRATAAA